MAFRLLPVRKRQRAYGIRDTAAEQCTTATAPSDIVTGLVATDAVCTEYMQWEDGLTAKPLQECAELATDVFVRLKDASNTGDEFAATLYKKACVMQEARQLVKQTILFQSVRGLFKELAARHDWREIVGSKEVFSAATRQFCGGRLSAFVAAVSADASSLPACDSLRASISVGDCSLALTRAIDAERLPELTIDMALVAHDGDVCSCGETTESGDLRFVAASGEALEDEPDARVYRAHVPLRFPRDIKLSQLCPSELLLVIGCMLVPLSMQRHGWKTLIISSGNMSRPHLIDRVCTDLVGLGVATDLKEVLRSVKHPRNRPFVLKLDWSAGKDEKFLDELHAVLKIGVVVVLRNEVGVPKEICAQTRLRLCTTHLRDLVVGSEEAWSRGRGLLFTEALKEYALHATSVPVSAIPFRDVMQGALYRPVPRRGMNAACFYMAEMIQMQYGFGLGDKESDFTIGLDYVTQALQAYAHQREIFEVSKAVTVEDVLQAASHAREDRHAVVTYSQECKIFKNLVRFAFKT